jgi:hypothetical protein
MLNFSTAMVLLSPVAVSVPPTHRTDGRRGLATGRGLATDGQQ